MMRLLTSFVISVILVGAGGCETPMVPVLTLETEGAAATSQVIKVTEKRTYYLYSSKDPKREVFHKDLKKGDELGFSVRGDRARALAGGTIVELSDYSEGASYSWKIEEKKKD